MTKVLHYIQTVGMGKVNNALLYTDNLVRATQNELESYVVKQDELGSTWLSFRSHYLRKLKEIQPDIVHIHGSWNYITALAEKLARKHGYFTVVSPHGAISPKMTEEPDFWKKKMPRMLAYELKMIKKTKYVIATDEDEETDLRKVGWKRRMTVVKATADEANDAETSKQLIAAYSKVIDTNYLLRITDEEKSLVNKCLRASLWEYDKLPDDLMLTEEDKTKIADLSIRRISLYTYDNNITELFSIGVDRLGISLPPMLDVENIPRFKEKTLSKTRWDKSIEKICSILTDLIDGITVDVDYTQTGELSLRTYGNIYSAIRFNDFDEDAFNIQIRKKFVKKTTARLMTKLQNDFGLEIGFMPILPK